MKDQSIELPFCFINFLTHEQDFEGGLKSFRPSLRETRDKRPLDRESNRRWCHRHTMSMIKLFWSQPMAPWASGQHTGKVKSSRPSLQPM